MAILLTFMNLGPSYDHDNHFVSGRKAILCLYIPSLHMTPKKDKGKSKGKQFVLKSPPKRVVAALPSSD